MSGTRASAPRRAVSRRGEARARRAAFVGRTRQQNRQLAAAAERRLHARLLLQPSTTTDDALGAASSLRMTDRVFPHAGMPEAVARHIDSFLDTGCAAADGWRLCAAPACRRECLVNFVYAATRVATELCQRHSQVGFVTSDVPRLVGRGKRVLEVAERELSGDFMITMWVYDRTLATGIFEVLKAAIPDAWDVVLETPHCFAVTVPALTTAVVGTFARFLIDGPVYVFVQTEDFYDDEGEDVSPRLLNVRTGEMEAPPAVGAAGGAGNRRRSRSHRRRPRTRSFRGARGN
jgi:hypothetical protein